MPYSPVPDTQQSAVHADPIAQIEERVREQVTRDVLREVSRVRSEPPPSKPPKSRMTRAVEHRWTPAAVAALIAAVAPILTVWIGRGDDEADLRKAAIEAARKERTAALDELRRELGQVREELQKAARRREGLNHVYGDAFCVLGVKSREWECDGIQLLPKPHPSSDAPRIQIRSDAPPAPE